MRSTLSPGPSPRSPLDRRVGHAFSEGRRWLGLFGLLLVIGGLLGMAGRLPAQSNLRAVGLFPIDGMNSDGMSSPTDLNNAGQVVVGGRSGDPWMVWFYGDVTVIDAPQGVGSALAINSSGQVAVTFNDGTAGRWKDGVVEHVVPPLPTPLPLPDLDRSRWAWGINDAGHLVGGALTHALADPELGIPVVPVEHAFFSANDDMVDLGVLPGEEYPFLHNSGAYAINNLGQVVGFSTSVRPPDAPVYSPQFPRATLFVGGTPTDLGTLGGWSSVAHAINNRGEIVGESFDAAQVTRAFVYAQGVMTELPGLGGQRSVAYDINDAGDIVGVRQMAGDPFGGSAFVRIDGQNYDLNQLAADFLATGDAPGFVNLYEATAINDLRQIVGYGRYRDGPGQPSYDKGFLLDLAEGPPAFKVHNSNRFGAAAGGLAGVTVAFIAGEQGIVASAVTNPAGVFSLDGLNVEPQELHDIQLQKGDWKRTYQAVRPQQVLDGTVRLVLPVQLQEKLAAELVKLRDTGLVVLDYDIERAQSLAASRNRLFPEALAAHQQNDQALGRLLAATESLARIYAVVEPLAKDAGKLLADNLVAFLAVKEASSQMGAAVAAELASSTLSERLRAFALNAIIASLKHTTDVAQKALVQGSQALLPPWGAELVNQSSATIIAGVLGAIAGGDWNAAGGKAEGRKKLLENLAKLLGEQVAGRIIASAHVTQTQQDLDLAEVRARSQQGAGTVAEAYVAALGKAIEAEEKADLALAQSSLIDDTATKFGYVADYVDVVGKVPGAQVAAMMARLIKVLNLGLVVKAVTDDFSTLAAITFEDTPAAAERAFFPTGRVEPLSALPVASLPTAAAAVMPLSAPPGFATALAAFRAAVVAAAADAALTAGEDLLALNGSLEQQLESALLQVRARLLSASPPEPALRESYKALQAAVVALRAALAELYPALAGHLVPELADPGLTNEALLALIDAAAQAVAEFDAADAAAQAAGSGITAPALVVILAHGLVGTPEATKTAPGPARLRATLFNAGDVAATDVVASLGLQPAAGSVAAFTLSGTPAITIGSLAPGEAVDVTWDGIATDVSASGVGSVAAYTLAVQAGAARAEGAGGGFEVISPPVTFADWIAGFSDLGGETAFGDDPDRDGLASGLEQFLGLHPGAASGARLQFQSGSGTPFFQHPRAAAYAREVTADYEWSLNLADWHASGASADGVSVVLVPQVVTGVGSEAKTVQVNSQVRGPAHRLFYRLKLTSTPSPPPDPEPTPPQIVTPPAAASVDEGQPAQFSVSVTGTGPVLYQWQKNGVDILGAIEASHVIPAVRPADAGVYTVRIVTPGGRITSAGAELSVNSAGGDS